MYILYFYLRRLKNFLLELELELELESYIPLYVIVVSKLWGWFKQQV